MAPQKALVCSVPQESLRRRQGRGTRAVSRAARARMRSALRDNSGAAAVAPQKALVCSVPQANIAPSAVTSARCVRAAAQANIAPRTLPLNSVTCANRARREHISILLGPVHTEPARAAEPAVRGRSLQGATGCTRGLVKCATTACTRRWESWTAPHVTAVRQEPSALGARATAAAHARLASRGSIRQEMANGTTCANCALVARRGTLRSRAAALAGGAARRARLGLSNLKEHMKLPGPRAAIIAPSAARENFVKGVEQALLAHATRSQLASSGSQPLRRGTVRPVNVRAALQASFGAAAAPCVQVIACPARRASSKLNEVRIQLHARSARRARRVSFAAVAATRRVAPACRLQSAGIKACPESGTAPQRRVGRAEWADFEAAAAAIQRGAVWAVHWECTSSMVVETLRGACRAHCARPVTLGFSAKAAAVVHLGRAQVAQQGISRSGRGNMTTCALRVNRAQPLHSVGIAVLRILARASRTPPASTRPMV